MLLRLCLISVLILVGGCSTITDKDIFPPGKETVEQVYDRHFGNNEQHNPTNVKRVLQSSQVSRVSDVAGTTESPFVRSAKRELHTLFPLVANRELVIYVYEHLATESGAPVPGYVTTFWLYDGRPYALPGEKTTFGE